MRPASLAMRTPLKRLAGAVISRLPEGPTPEQRERMRWMIVCEAKRGEVERKGVISGRDVYGLTAAAIVQGRDHRLQQGLRGPRRPGALAGVRARGFLPELEHFDVRWEISESTPVPVEA